MKKFFTTLVIVLLFAAPVQADNKSLFQEIRDDVSELETLLDIVSDDGIDIGWGVTLPLPAAVRATMITRMLALRTAIRDNLNALTVE